VKSLCDPFFLKEVYSGIHRRTQMKKLLAFVPVPVILYEAYIYKLDSDHRSKFHNNFDFIPGSADEMINDAITTGDIVLFAHRWYEHSLRHMIQMKLFQWQHNTCYDHVGIIVINAEGDPIICERNKNTFKLPSLFSTPSPKSSLFTYIKFSERILCSRARSITIVPTALRGDEFCSPLKSQFIRNYISREDINQTTMGTVKHLVMPGMNNKSNKKSQSYIEMEKNKKDIDDESVEEYSLTYKGDDDMSFIRHIYCLMGYDLVLSSSSSSSEDTKCVKQTNDPISIPQLLDRTVMLKCLHTHKTYEYQKSNVEVRMV
jgi:hypothetical protein